MRLLGDNHGWKEGRSLMGFTFLMKATSPKWELAESILQWQRGEANTNNEGGKTRLCKLLQLLSREI